METMPDREFSEELLTDSEYSRKSEFNKAVITQTQISKCLELRSKDMKPGYTNWVIDKSGSAKPQIIGDSRKEFISSVEALKNLLYPEIQLKAKDLLDNYSKEKKNIFNKYAYKERVGKRYEEGKPVWIYSKRLYMPHKGQPLIDHDSNNPMSLKTTMNANLWDANIDAYYDELVILADELFAELNELIHTLDYFKGGMSF